MRRRRSTARSSRKRPTASGRAPLAEAAAGGQRLGAGFGEADQPDDRAVDRRGRCRAARRSRTSSPLMIIDLGLAAGGKVVGHRRARLGVDLPGLEEEVVEQPVGRSRSPMAAARVAAGPTFAGLIPARRSRRSAFALAPRRQRVDSRARFSSSISVRPDSALTALLRLMSSLPQARPSMSLDSRSAAGRRRLARPIARVSRRSLGPQSRPPRLYGSGRRRDRRR